MIFWNNLIDAEKKHLYFATNSRDQATMWSRSKNVKKFKKNSFEVSENWIINSRKLLLHDLTVYVFLSTAVRKKLMKIHYDNLYIDHFRIKKIINLLWKKYYWQKLFKNMKNYVKICNICQHMKVSHYKFYNKLILFFISQKVWNFIAMNFIMSLFSLS